MSESLALSGAAPDAQRATLEDTLNQVEQHLASLGSALCARDLNAIGTHAHGLQVALAQAVDRFSHAAKQGPVPEPLRRRLASAGALVAAQRESLARATAALDRAIEVLLPRQAAACYSRQGSAERNRFGGVVQA